MRNKLLQNDFKVQPPSTWLGKLIERLKRFFTLPYNWTSAWSQTPTANENKNRREDGVVKLTNADNNKLAKGISPGLPNQSNDIKDSQKQANRHRQHHDSLFWQGSRQKPINGTDKPLQRGKRIKR